MFHELSTPLTQQIQRAIIRKPLTLAMDAMVSDAIALMAPAAQPSAASPNSTTPEGQHSELRSSCVFVVNKAQKVLGMLSERDVIGLLAKAQSLEALSIAAVMTQPKLIIREANLSDGLVPIEQLQQTGIFPCPIVDDRDRLIGMMTASSWYNSQMASARARTATEATEQDSRDAQQASPSKLSQANKIHPPQQSFIDSLPIGILKTNTTSEHHQTNATWHQLTGISHHHPQPNDWQQQLHPDDKARVIAEWQTCQEDNRPFQMEYRFQHTDGTVVWVQGQSTSKRDANGQLPVLSLIDIRDRKAAEAQLQTHNNLLARILRDEPLKNILEGIIDCVKQQIQGPICSFLLIDEDGRLRYGAAPDHPQDYILQTDGAPTGEGIGSCGTAVARKQTVIVTNIATDSLWKDYKDIALKHGLLACWSHPVMASNGSVLGTFALYYPEIRTPQSHELKIVAQMAHMAGIAIERHQAIAELAQLNRELEQRVEDRTAALQASQVQFRQLAENLPGMVYRYVIHPDRSGQFSYISHGIKEIYEVDPDDVKRNPQSLWQRIHPEERPTVQAQITQSLQNLSPFFSEHRLLTPSGVKWVKSIAQPSQQENDDIFLDGMVIDITTRKTTEAALAQEALRRTSIFNASLDGIHILDINGNLLEANSSFAKMLGYTEKEVSQLNVADWEPNWTPSKLSAMLRKTSRNSYTFETQHRRKDGAIFPVEVSRQYMEWKGETSIVCISRDISEWKAAELELKKSRQRYYSLIQSIKGIVWEYDILTGKFVFVSNQVESLLGYPAEKWLQDPSFCIQHIYEKDRERVATLFTEGIQQSNTFSSEHQVVAADGHLVWVYEVATPHLDENGVPITLSGLTIDIGDRKNTELKLRQLNEELLRATRLKDEFLANMSHELRTPLNSIMGMTEGLNDQLLGSINSKQQSALEIIEQSSSHLLELINDILDVAKFDSGQLQLSCDSTQVDSLCQSSLAFIKQPALKKQIQLKTNIPPAIPALILDERRMRQVLINLLSNAVKFTPQGGCVTLTVKVLDATQQGNQPRAMLHLDVADTGIGIAPENLSSLFQPFIQIDSALNRKFQGTGLGLTLVKQIVELHGGEVSLKSQLGQGSCFTIEIPCPLAEAWIAQSPTEAEISIATQADPTAVESAPLILLAEDNAANIATISAYLKAKGHRLIIATDGKEAIKRAQQDAPDLILMDIQMPAVDGLTAIAQIRKVPRLTQTPIIALTALAMDGDRDRCIAAGANDYLCKPVKLKQLTALIQELLPPKKN